MSDPTSPGTPYKGKIVNLRIKFLDDTVHAFQVPVKAVGQALWEAVVKHLQLVETDYFGLQYDDSHGLKCWVDNEKFILKQLPSPDSPLEFCVKFYTPDPGLLDEFTRYLYALQIKKDLQVGSMQCSENTAALIASYITQADIGDFIIEEYHDYTYLNMMGVFVPGQTEEMLKKVMEYHKQHIGESPAEAEAGLLDTARKVEMYGIRLCRAKDHEGVALHLAVAHMGILVFQNSTKINTFSWAKIRKLSFKRKKFLVKLHPETYVTGQKGYYKDTVEFFFESRDECKNFWKKCIEHHAFFRCHMAKSVPRNKTRLVSRGSSFRYSGRTQKQLMNYVRENPLPAPQFQRSVSGRISASRSTSVTPKIPTKVVLHNSSNDTHNSTASSGSHVLNPDEVVSPNKIDHVDSRSVDSSVSGSHSLNSPRMDGHRSREVTPGLNISLDGGREEAELDKSRAESEERGAHFVVTNNIVCNDLDKNDTKLSANQNANDNDDTISQDSYHLESDPKKENLATCKNENIGVNGGGDLCIDTNAGAMGLTNKVYADMVISTPEKLSENQVTQQGNVSLVKDNRKVVFADEVEKSSDSQVLESDSHQIMKTSGKVVIKLNEEVPVGTCITVSVDVSPTHEVRSVSSPSQGQINVSSCNQSRSDILLETKIKSSTIMDVHKSVKVSNDVVESAAASGTVIDKVDTTASQHGASPEGERNLDNGNDDLIEDIPYYLERRHYEQELSEQNENNSCVLDSSVPEKVSFIRRGRSSKKKRPSNMQIEHVKVYEGTRRSPEKTHPGELPISPSSECGSPVSKRPQAERRSPSVHSRSPSGGARNSSRSSLERSPSCNRRLDIVNFHKLPPKDSFSCVDDTTSPTFEKDILKQVQNMPSVQRENSLKGTSQNCDIVNNIPNGHIQKTQRDDKENKKSMHTESTSKVSNVQNVRDADKEVLNVRSADKEVLNMRDADMKVLNLRNADKEVLNVKNADQEVSVTNTATKQETVNNQKETTVLDGKASIAKSGVLIQHPTSLPLSDEFKRKLEKQKPSVSIDLPEPLPQHMDLPSQAAAFILSDSDYARKPNRTSITFSTFKPEDSSYPSTPGSRPLSQVGMEEECDIQSETDYGSLPSAKHADSKKPIQFAIVPDDNVFIPTKPRLQIPEQASKQKEIIHAPGHPRKVSFHKERGYMYSFESVNEPPSFALAEPIEDLDIDSLNKSVTESAKGDMLKPLEDLVGNKEMADYDSSESSGSHSDVESHSEHESSDEETVKHDELLKFAKSLADSGKEFTNDSGVGVDITDSNFNMRDSSCLDPLETLERLEDTTIEEEEKNELNRKDQRCFLDNEIVSKSFTDSSISSGDSEGDKTLNGKRYSVDPLLALENPSIMENSSFGSSDEDEEDEKDSRSAQSKDSNKNISIPMLTFSSASSPDDTAKSPQEFNDNDFSASIC